MLASGVAWSVASGPVCPESESTLRPRQRAWRRGSGRGRSPWDTMWRSGRASTSPVRSPVTSSSPTSSRTSYSSRGFRLLRHKARHTIPSKTTRTVPLPLPSSVGGEPVHQPHRRGCACSAVRATSAHQATAGRLSMPRLAGRHAPAIGGACPRPGEGCPLRTHMLPGPCHLPIGGAVLEPWAQARTLSVRCADVRRSAASAVPSVPLGQSSNRARTSGLSRDPSHTRQEDRTDLLRQLSLGLALPSRDHASQAHPHLSRRRPRDRGPPRLPRRQLGRAPLRSRAGR